MPVDAATGCEAMSTTPDGPFVVRTTAELVDVGAGVTVPEMDMLAFPEYDEPVWTVRVAPAAEAATGPRTRKAARRTVASVLSVFILITV